MANYNESQLLVSLKAFSRSNPLPLDATSVWDSKSSADTYAKEANSYSGQIITAKVDGEYKAFVLQGENGNCTLAPIGVDTSAVKQYVQIGTRPSSAQEQGVIYIENNVGYIWNGSKYVKIFEDVSSSIADFEDRIGTLETDITTKANLANPNFTGSVKLDGKDLATKEYADAIVAAAKSEVPIVIDANHPFPATGYKAGQKYVVAVAGTYLGEKCEIGDVILITKDYATGTAANTDGIILQANIDGAVTGADSAVDGDIVVFSGATGKVIKSSTVNMSVLNDVIAKAHEHANKTVLDSYDKTQTELLTEAATIAQGKVDTLKTTVEGKADKSTTLAGYGITNAYTKDEIESKLTVITTNVNTKVDAATVDDKIATAKEEILTDHTTMVDSKINTKVGDLGESATVVEYVNKVVGSGGSDVATQIDNALKEAKAYTDKSLEIVEF